MNKEKLQQRINELKSQNDEDNIKLNNLNQMQQTIIQQVLVRNGRILELENFLERSDYCFEK